MRAATIFALCMASALVCAFAFVVMLKFSLLTTDLAYRETWPQHFSNPIMINGAIVGGTFFGVLSFPLVYFGLRGLRLLTAGPLVFCAVFGEVMLVTPFAGWVGVPGSVFALGIGLIFCRCAGWKCLEEPLAIPPASENSP